MGFARRTLLGAMLAAVAAPAVSRLARGDAPAVVLKLHHSFSSVSSPHERFLAPWARKVEADAGGRIRVDVFPSMQLGGAPAQLLDQARDGLADIVWAAPSNTPGRFVKIEVFELPFISARRAFVSSKAIEDYAAAHLLDEFRDVHPLCFSCCDRGVVHAKRAIGSIADIKGLRLHVPNRLAVEAMNALGAKGVIMPNPQLSIALQQHVISGCLDRWGVLPPLKLDTVLKEHTEFPEHSPSTTAFVLAMNRAVFDRLPPDLKAIINANSGQPVAGAAGAMWDADAAVAAAAAQARGEAIVTLAPEEAARWRKATEPVIALWIKQMKEHRVDGDKLLASAGVLFAKYANEPEPQPTQPVPPTAVGAPPAQAKAELPVPPKPAPQPAPPQRPKLKVLEIPL